MTFLLFSGILIFLVNGAVGLDLATGRRSIRRLRDQPADIPANAPSVSIIVAARNEERNIRSGLRSLLELDYPRYQVIVVDDRSTDRTGDILGELAAADPRLQVIRVDDLPAEWLGKNHALWLGNRNATGDFLLFTDADIVMNPDTLARAMSLVHERRLDHLAVSPEVRMPGLFLDMFGTAFMLFFSLYARPWKAKDPRSRFHIGIGAFNLVRADAYRRCGGHETIRLRPDDDMKLGKIIKKSGFRQDIAFGEGLVSVEWYASVREAVRGLEKNAFAGADYRVSLVTAGILFYAIFNLWPFAAAWIASGPARAVYLGTVFLMLLLFLDIIKGQNKPSWYVIGYPLTVSLFIYILLRTMSVNLWKGGIRWRETFYPLRELKRNKI